MKTLAEIQAIVSEIESAEGRYVLVPSGDGFLLKLQYEEGGVMQSSRKWYISAWATKSEIVKTALEAAIACASYKVRKAFKYRGVSIFDPHINVDGLLDQELEVRQ